MRGMISLIDWRPLMLVNGIFLCCLSVLMLIPALLDWHDRHNDAHVFLFSSVVTLFIGMSLYITHRGYRVKELTLREAFLLTASVWFVIPAFSALPFMFSELRLSFPQAFFEASSGLTTTGSTVLSGLDNMPRGLLLWRSLLCYAGGQGIVVFAVAVLPALGVGGMQLFRTESSDRSDKILPRARQISAVIAMTYFWLNLACMLTLWMAGMSGFDAVNHAMSIVATGGFSTHDASMGYFKSPAIEWTTIVFMFLGGLPFLLMFQGWQQMLRGQRISLWNDSQVRWYAGFILLAAVLMTCWLAGGQHFDSLHDAFRHALFNVVSVVTTSGYASYDYMQWGTFSWTFFFLITTVGGCTGSTSGGIKIFRLQVMMEAAKVQIKQAFEPHGVFRARFNGRAIDPKVTAAVTGFIVLWGMSFMVLTALVSLHGLDFETAMSGVAASLANVGPGIGQYIGPAGNFSRLPDEVLNIFSIAMILGRLELVTLLVLFIPAFWRN